MDAISKRPNKKQPTLLLPVEVGYNNTILFIQEDMKIEGKYATGTKAKA
jgi:hypothetical protein